MPPYPASSAIAAGPQARADLGTPTTDLSNAERFAADHSINVRHHHESGWYAYDSGTWRRNEALVADLAQKTVRMIYEEAAACEDPKERKLLASWAQKSESARAISAILQLARSDALIRIDPKQFDSDHWLLNCRNGVVELRTGKLRQHEQLDYMTKQAPVDYKPGAEHPTWTRFLDTMLPDLELREFVQKAAGYSLTGDTSCEVLFFVYGPTRSGKSTFTGALKACLGDYSTTANFESFLAKRDRDSRNSMAALWGARLVVSLEVDRGRTFAAALVKAVTGMDSIKAMFKYREEFEYTPTWKLWLVANDRPKADSEDDALWRRMIVLPFDHSLPANEQDPAVKETLFNDPSARQAILSWAVQGCMKWIASDRRLTPPESVTQAVSDYREGCDDLSAFFDECCEFDPKAETASSDILSACKKWCEENSIREPWGQDVAARLKKKGCEPARTAGRKRTWIGIALKATDMFS